MVKQIIYFIVTIAFLSNSYAQDVMETEELANKAKELVVSWIDGSQNRQKKSLVELNIMFNRGELIDLPQKKDIFNILIKNSPDNYFLYQSILFLSKFNKDDEILLECNNYLTSKGYENKAIMASLTYCLAYDASTFDLFFSNKNFLDVDESLRTFFANTAIVSKKRSDFLYETFQKMLAGKEKHDIENFTADAPNQYYQMLLKNREYIPEFISKNKKHYMTPSLPLDILYLLGEIHSFESFDLLLENYLADPSFRSSISLAACTGSFQVDTLFATLNSKNLLDKFLENVLGKIPGNLWNEICGSTFSGKLKFYKDNYEKILIKTRQRAKPILG